MEKITLNNYWRRKYKFLGEAKSTKWIHQKLFHILMIPQYGDMEQLKNFHSISESRNGHIPGSLNIPYKLFFNENMTFKSKEEIEDCKYRESNKYDISIHQNLWSFFQIYVIYRYICIELPVWHNYITML